MNHKKENYYEKMSLINLWILPLFPIAMLPQKGKQTLPGQRTLTSDSLVIIYGIRSKGI